jgi:ABC-type Na+ efflux pump permease subunit
MTTTRGEPDRKRDDHYCRSPIFKLDTGNRQTYVLGAEDRFFIMKRTVVRLAAIAILVAILIGISVIKSNISAGREKQKIASIKEQYYRTQDSVLLNQLNDSIRAYIDSIERLEDVFQGEIDSLNRYYAERESLMAVEHQIEVESLKGRKKKSGERARESSSNSSLEEKIRADYDHLYELLPADLTSYEKKVSINEIVLELSKRHSISPDSIRRILEK